MIQGVLNKGRFDEVLGEEGLVVVYFFAAWHPECQGLAPRLQEIANGLPTNAKIYKVDIDENPETVQAAEVSETPLF